jgi:hypothetical protein
VVVRWGYSAVGFAYGIGLLLFDVWCVLSGESEMNTSPCRDLLQSDLLDDFQKIDPCNPA